MTIFGIGCGDDDDGTGNKGGALTSIDGATRLDSLSGKEQATLSIDIQKYLKSLVTDYKMKLCTSRGIFMTPSSSPEDDEMAQAACVLVRDPCLNESDQLREDLLEIPEPCDATVHDYIACNKIIFDELAEELNSQPACENLTLEHYETKADQDMPDACVTLEEKCPDIN